MIRVRVPIHEMLREGNLEPSELVFGDFISPRLNVSTQVATSSIEACAGLSFDGLAEVDPLGQEGLDDSRGPLVHPSQIRFI